MTDSTREGRDEQQDEKEESKLRKVIRDDTQNDKEGILYVMYETIKEIDASIQVSSLSDPERDDDEDEGFKALSRTPATCANDEVGPLFTNEDVSNAIQRTGSVPQAPLGSEDNPEEETRRQRVVAKDGKKVEKQAPKTEAGNCGEGIFGAPTQHSKWSLNNYLQSVASTREKRIVAVTAWGLAFVGLIVALVFVTLDFIDSREELASTVRYEDSERLELPPLFFCTADSEMPLFMDLPNEKYVGKPLFWLDYIRGTDAGINITYPDTKNLKQLSIGSYDVMGRACNASRVMDPLIYFREITVKPSCFYCLTLNRKPGLRIRKERGTGDGIRFSKLASLRLSQNSFVTHCRLSQFGLPGMMVRFFREELRRHHGGLSERGILDFGGYDASNRSDDGILWPGYRLGLQNTSVDFVIYDIVDMFCNVYLFSGFFYPSSSSGIKYKFNSRLLRWERSGSGPYYPRDYFEYYTRSEDIVLYSGNVVIGQEKHENRSMYDSSTIEIRTNHSRIGGAETLAVLGAKEIASVELSRNIIKEREWFVCDKVRTSLLAGDVRTVNNVYMLDITFKSLLTRVVSDQQSVSWSAFMADFFGLTSLFMDVSVYTLIVSPLIMKGRRRALAARKRRLEAACALDV